MPHEIIIVFKCILKTIIKYNLVYIHFDLGRISVYSCSFWFETIIYSHIYVIFNISIDAINCNYIRNQNCCSNWTRKLGAGFANLFYQIIQNAFISFVRLFIIESKIFGPMLVLVSLNQGEVAGCLRINSQYECSSILNQYFKNSCNTLKCLFGNFDDHV